MIVRDNAKTLPACLASISRWTDELVVVDTGSHDDTPAISRHYNARLFSFPWCDDFSAARNESLRHARGEWLFWMDSDDTIDERNGRRLRELASAEHPLAILGFVMQVHCPGPNAQGEEDFTFVDQVKLVRNLPNLRFDGRIHEQILPSIRRVGGDVAWTDIHVVHSGSDLSVAGRRRKHERDLRILNLELQDRPDHPFTLFNLGMTHADAGDYEQAVHFLDRSIQVALDSESYLRKAYALLVNANFQLFRFDAAKEACRRGRKLFPDDPELRFREGAMAHQECRFRSAEEAYLDVLDRRREQQFSSVDMGIFTYKSRHNLALLYENMEQLRLVEMQWRHIIAEKPYYRVGWRGLVESLIMQHKFEAAKVEIEHMTSVKALHCLALQLASCLAEALGDSDVAARHIRQALEEYPDDVETLEANCKYLFQRGEPSEAKVALERLAALTPCNGAVWRNLGVINLRLGLRNEAIADYETSIRLRPDSEATRREFEHLCHAAAIT
jgi:glycosyltransferase involved in cell wall biosynthesis